MKLMTPDGKCLKHDIQLTKFSDDSMQCEKCYYESPEYRDVDRYVFEAASAQPHPYAEAKIVPKIVLP